LDVQHTAAGVGQLLSAATCDIVRTDTQRGTVHVAIADDMHTTFQSEFLKGKDLSEDLGVDGKILLECTLGK